jgi:hypothetical protein
LLIERMKGLNAYLATSNYQQPSIKNVPTVCWLLRSKRGRGMNENERDRGGPLHFPHLMLISFVLI